MDLIVQGPPEQAWRDLSWLATAPDLLSVSLGNALDLPPPSLSMPDETAAAWQPIKRHFERRAAHRVGYYVESLVELWLSGTPGCSEIEHGILIRQGKTTLGELDFLYRQDDRLHHLEVALKFFLYHPLTSQESSATESHFPGPNAADNFEKKRDKLLQQQLPLGKEHFPEIARSYAFVKGMIFYPPELTRPDKLPELMNPGHRTGFWIRSSGLDWLLESPRRNGRGIIMEKPFWLSGLESQSGSPPPGLAMVDLHTAVSAHFHYRNSPLLLSLANLREQGYREAERVVVVPPDWPGNVQRFKANDLSAHGQLVSSLSGKAID